MRGLNIKKQSKKIKPFTKKSIYKAKVNNNRKGVRKNKDGTVSTHLMAQADNYAYPTLFQNKDNSWEEKSDDNNWAAQKEAIKRKEIYKFDTEKEARNFANGSWKKKNTYNTKKPINKAVEESTKVKKPFKKVPKTLSKKESVKRRNEEASYANKKAFINSTKQAKIELAKEDVKNNFDKVSNSVLWNLPGSVSPMAIEDLVLFGVVEGAKALKIPKLISKVVEKINFKPLNTISKAPTIKKDVEEIANVITPTRSPIRKAFLEKVNNNISTPISNKEALTLRRQFIDEYGYKFNEKDLGLYIRNKINSLEENKPLPIFLKEETEDFIKRHSLNVDYSKNDKVLLDAYTRGSDMAMNRRSKALNTNMDFYEKEIIPSFEKVILKNKLKSPLVVSRGDSNYTATIIRNGKEIKVPYRELKEGDIEVPNSFVSTSLNKNSNVGDLSLQSNITLPKGQSVAYPNSNFSHVNYATERELTLPNKLKYKIDKVHEYKAPIKDTKELHSLNEKQLKNKGIRVATKEEIKKAIIRRNYLKKVHEKEFKITYFDFIDNFKLTEAQKQEIKIKKFIIDGDSKPLYAEKTKTLLNSKALNDFKKYSKSIVNPYLLPLLGGTEAINILSNTPKDNTQDMKTKKLKLYKKGGTINKTDYVPKAPFGALIPLFASLISTGVGIVTNKHNNKIANRQIKKQEDLDIAQNQAESYAQSEQVAAGVDTAGESISSFYQEKGGVLKNNLSPYTTKGGELVPTSSDTDKVEGQTHAQGGVRLDVNGKPIAEVEGEEMIKDDRKVYSDKLKPAGSSKTYASIVEALSKKKGKLEKEISSNNVTPIKKRTITRMINNLDAKEDRLFEEQESMKKTENIQTDFALPKGEDGLDLFNNIFKRKSKEDRTLAKEYRQRDRLLRKDRRENKIAVRANEKAGVENKAADTGTGAGFAEIAGEAVPFIDNVFNMINTANKPRVPRPRITPRASLKTTVNVNDQLSEVNNAVQQSQEFVQANSSNSNVARGNSISSRLGGAKQINKILAFKENKETELSNQKALSDAASDRANNAILTNNDQMKLDRRLAMASENSANVADVVDYRLNQEKVKREEALDLKKINIYANSLDNHGTSNRFILSLLPEDSFKLEYERIMQSGSEKERAEAEAVKLSKGYNF